MINILKSLWMYRLFAWIGMDEDKNNGREVKTMAENRTTINIDKDIIEEIRKRLSYKKVNGKHYLETYDDFFKRILKLK